MGYSFIIPVFNCRETLLSCVESIRAAGLSQYEILLIDDGSTDGSAGICDALGEAYPEIWVFHQENAGVSAARNRGLREARFQRILFVDGDDAVDGSALRRVLQQEGDLLIFGATGTGGTIPPGELDWRGDFLPLFWENLWSPVWNKVYQKQILAENSLFFREEMFLYEDLEFVLRYLAHCGRVVYAPEVAYRHRPSQGATRRVKRMGRISEYLHPLEAALGNLSLSGETVDAVRMGLFTILAREKIAVSNRKETKEICRDFQGWYKEAMKNTNFTRKLLQGRAHRLWLESRMAAMRHALAKTIRRTE